MTKSILINYIGYPTTPSTLMPDNGLANLAGSLIKKGHETIILDYNTTDSIKRLFPQNNSGGDLNAIIKGAQEKDIQAVVNEISSLIKKRNIDFVGFKLLTGEGFKSSVKIAEKLKKDNPKLPIFAGGPHVDWFRERIYNITDAFDTLAYGEGEETIVGLAEYVERRKKLDEIPNLFYKENGNIKVTPIKRVENLDDLAFPIYDESIYPAMKGDNKIKIMMLDESRGCPNSCNFCIHPIKSGSKRRIRSPKRLVGEIKEMISRYNTRFFRFAGSNTPGIFKEELAREFIKENLPVVYTAFGHVGDKNADFKILKESGCYSLFFGIESGSQKILKESINKRSSGKIVNINQIIDSINACKKGGIFPVGSIIFPAPLETEETKQESLDLLLNKISLNSVLVCLPAVVLGTEWEKNHEKYSITYLNPKTFDRDLMNYTAKLFFPPILWDPFPYNINNKPFKEYVVESNDFVQRLEQNGILTQVSDEMLLMANLAKKTPRQFRDDLRKYFSSGDYENMKDYVKTINSNCSVK